MERTGFERRSKNQDKDGKMVMKLGPKGLLSWAKRRISWRQRLMVRPKKKKEEEVGLPGLPSIVVTYTTDYSKVSQFEQVVAFHSFVYRDRSANSIYSQFVRTVLKSQSMIRRTGAKSRQR